MIYLMTSVSETTYSVSWWIRKDGYSNCVRGWTIRGSNSGKNKRCLLFHNVQTRSGAHAFPF